MKRSVLVLTCLVCVLCMSSFVVKSFAVPITIIHSGVSGTGTIGGIPFSNAAFTITALGDTANRQSFGSGFFIDHGSASISIASVGNFTFITGTRTFVNNGGQIPGFSRAGISGADLFNGPGNAAWATWDMLTSIGPIVGQGNLIQWASPLVSTNGGQLVFNNGNTQATVQATVGPPIPEPSTYLLFAVGILGIIGMSYRQRRKAA